MEELIVVEVEIILGQALDYALSFLHRGGFLLDQVLVVSSFSVAIECELLIRGHD